MVLDTRAAGQHPFPGVRMQEQAAGEGTYPGVTTPDTDEIALFVGQDRQLRKKLPDGTVSSAVDAAAHNHFLSTLADVIMTGENEPVIGQLLQFNGTHWVPGGTEHEHTFDSLSDVDTITDPPTLGQLLQWDDTNWVPANPTITVLADVDTTSTPPEAGDTLVYDGTNWVPGEAAAGSGGGQVAGPYATAMLATADLAGYWRGYDARDSAPIGSGGSLVGGNSGAGAGPSLLPNEPASQSFIFAGPTSFFVAPHNGTLLDVGDIYTLIAVIRPASVSGTPAIMANGHGSFLLRQNGTSLNLLRSNVADIVSSTGVTLAINTTYHVAATKNGATVKLYINGVDVTGVVSNSTNTDTTTQFYIGANTGGIDGYTGKIAEVAVVKRALSAGEISDLFDLTGL